MERRSSTLEEGLPPDETLVPRAGVSQSSLTSEQLEMVVNNVLNEADLDKTGVVSLLEFKHIVTKSPDFAQSFRMRL